MTMDHKAFVFDTAAFEAELGKPLYEALEGGTLAELERFIERNLEHLKDPCEGEPLDHSWRSLLETRDAHQYGDVAITKYYDPASDIGLGQDWEFHSQRSEILGRPFGPPRRLFDPGKLGSYFFTSEEVRQKLSDLRAGAESPGAPERHPDALRMFELAASSGKGLYTTF